MAIKNTLTLQDLREIDYLLLDMQHTVNKPKQIKNLLEKQRLNIQDILDSIEIKFASEVNQE